MGARDQTLVAECCERCIRELGIRLEVLGIMGFQALEHHGLSVLKITQLCTCLSVNVC